MFSSSLRVALVAVPLTFLSSVAFGQELQDFESVAPGTTVNSFPAQGISLGNPLDGARCDSNPVIRGDSNCVSARSGVIVARTQLPFEFNREPFRINFAALQDTVRAYVRYDGNSVFNGEPIRVSIGAVDEEGELFGSNAISFTHQFSDGIWHELSISERLPIPTLGIPGQKIAGIVIWGGVDRPPALPTPDEASNFLIIDDLTFDRIAELPEDNQAPLISRFDVVRTTQIPSVEADIRVTEQGPELVARLDTVQLRIVHGDGTVISDFDDTPICGGTSSACPQLVYQSPAVFRIGLQDDLPGDYAITVRACDVSDNCALSGTRTITYEPLPPPPPIRSWRMEITQGMQTLSGFIEPAQLGIASFPSAAGPFLPNRDTLVRYYLVATDAIADDYTQQVTLKVWKQDGSVPSYTLRPNTQIDTVDVEVDPGDTTNRRTLAMSQRPLLEKTLNFVIPAELLSDADMFAVRLGQFGIDEDPITAEMQVNLVAPATFGLLPVQLVASGFNAPTTENLIQQNEILRAQFPISGDILYPNPTQGQWASSSDTTNPNIVRMVNYPRRRSKDCQDVLEWTCTLLSGDTNTFRRTLSGAPDLALDLGLVGNGFEGCAGMAYRPGTISIAEVDAGIVVANQEIVHNMGVRHAGDDHGESDGGSSEPWPYPHGQISPDGISTFGVVLDQTGFDSLTGSWDVTLIDPCRTDPLDDLSQRQPECTLAEDAEIMHDFMSYAGAPSWTEGVPTGSNRFTWAADITWDRIFAAIRAAGPSSRRQAQSLVAKSQQTPVADTLALIVAGTIDHHGELTSLSPLTRKVLPASALTPSAGDHTLRLFDTNGGLLLEHQFVAEHNDDATGDSHFWVALADATAPSARLDVVGPTDDVLGSAIASDNAPTVTLLAPNGGEQIGPNSIDVRWQSGDADGDELYYLVQVSPDDGQSWLGLGLTEPGAPTELTVSLLGLIPSDEAIVRVIASDGFHTAMDDSDAVFSLTTPGNLFVNGFER